jgi:spore coat protein CotF
MLKYGIPLPVRPPKQTQTTFNLEVITDRYSYRRILRGIQAFLSTHIQAFIHSTNPNLREIFMTFMVEEMKLYDKFLEYGKIKGYEIRPPIYKI